MTSRHGNATAEPGVKVFLWPVAFSHAVQAAVDRTFDEGTLSVAYKNGITSHETTVTKIVKPTLWLTVNPGKLTLNLTNAEISVRHQRRHDQYEEDFVKRVSGSFEITIDVLRPDPLHDPLYDAEITLVDLLFTVNSSAARTFGGGSFLFLGDVTCSSFQFNGSTFNFQFGSQKHPRDDDEDKIPDPKRSRPISAPIYLSGINQSFRSTSDSDSIVCSGLNSRVVSSGRDAAITASGTQSAIVSSGPDVSISVSGTCASVDSTGLHARIHSSGTDCSVKSSGPNASIQSSGTGVSVVSSGANARIHSSGTNTTVKSTGDLASISFNGVDTRIQSNGSAIDDDFGRTLINTLTDAVRNALNSDLPDSSLSSDWTIGNGFLSSRHLVTLPESDDPLLLPQGITFPDPQNSGRMFTVFISNCVLNAVLSSFHRNKIFNCNLTQADLVSEATRNIASTSGTADSLSDCLPGFSDRFPGASLEVETNSIEAPTLELSDQNLDVGLRVLAIFRARLPDDDSLVDFLTVEINLTTTVLLTMEPGKLKGTVVSMKPKSLNIVKSLLESVDQKVLKDVFELISAQFLRRKFQEATQKGIPIPRPLLSGVEGFENVRMTSANDFLRVDADLKFCA